MRADAQQRREHGAGEAEHEQQRAEVGDQEVLGHVRGEQLLRSDPIRVSVATMSVRPP